MTKQQYLKSLLAAAKQIRQERKAAAAAEYAELAAYIKRWDLSDKYKAYLMQHNLSDTLKSARAFKEEHERLSSSHAALSHIWANGLQKEFLFFQTLPEYRNKTIDEQLLLFADWQEKNGVIRAVL